MQLSTVISSVKVIFALVVIALIVYLVLQLRRINTGSWKVNGTNDVLQFIDPDNKVVFSISAKDNGVFVNNYLIKGDPNSLQFFSPDQVNMVQMRKNEIQFGDLALYKSSDWGSTLGIADKAAGKMIAGIGDRLIYWPNAQTIIKAETATAGQNTVKWIESLYAKDNGTTMWKSSEYTVPKTQPINNSLNNTYYNLI